MYVYVYGSLDVYMILIYQIYNNVNFIYCSNKSNIKLIINYK